MYPSQYKLTARLVDLIHLNFQGFHPGYRDVHSSGRYYAGSFRATDEAGKLTRAVHFRGEPVPVTIRYSNSRSGNPWGPATTASMAVRFYLPDGTFTNLVALPLPLFPTRTPEETVEFLEAVRPDPATGKPDETRMGTFFASHPWCAHAAQLSKALPAAVSLAQVNFHALHAFKFVNEAGEVCHGRYHWVPKAGAAAQTLEELQSQAPSYLFDELEARLRTAPVVFDLELQLAASGDPLDDPNAPWPEDRRRVRLGQLDIQRTTTVEEIGDAVMNHDPTMLTDGIEATPDPILAVRRGVYELSVAYRTGGWRGRQAAWERAGICPFGGTGR